MWAQFKDRAGDINNPDNYIQGTAGTIPPWGNTWRRPDLWQAEGWRNDLPADWIPSQPPKSTEHKLFEIRAERDRLLDVTTWIFQRQQTGTEAQKLPAEQYQEWVDYWAALRDFPAICNPDNPVWPKQPNL